MIEFSLPKSITRIDIGYDIFRYLSASKDTIKLKSAFNNECICTFADTVSFIQFKQQFDI